MAVKVDNKTSRLNLPLPDKDNFLLDDVERIKQAFDILDKDVALVDASGKLASPLPDNAATVDPKTQLLDPKHIPSTVVQTASGKIPVGVMPLQAVPTVHPAQNVQAMLALSTATVGDVCRRADTGAYYMLVNTPTNNVTNWREIPPSAVYSINGVSGAITGVSIKTADGRVPAVTDGKDPGDAVNKSQLDKAGGGYVSQLIWHHNRSNIPDGYLIGDGQEVDRATAPSLFAEVQAGRVPVCTEAEWWAEPGKRGCYTLGATSGKFRVPDYNGAQLGSAPAPFTRGGYPTDVQYKGWIQRNAAPNIVGTMSIHGGGTANGTPISTAGGALVGEGVIPGTYIGGTGDISFVYKDANNVNKTATIPGTIKKASNAQSVGSLRLDASLSDQAYGRVDTIPNTAAREVRPNAIVGCYIIRFAGRSLEPGAVDPVATAQRLEQLFTKVEQTSSKIGYALMDFGTMGLNTRKVLTNPFGNKTPVICQAEVYHSTLKKWVSGAWVFNPTGNTSTYGVRAAYAEDEGIVVRTGATGLLAYNNGTVASGQGPASGASQEFTGSYATPSLVRVHVWNIGKDTTKLEYERASIIKTADLWLSATDPRVLEYIEWPSDMVFGLAGNQVSPGELLVNIKANAIHVKGIVRRNFKASKPTASTAAAPLTQAQIDANYIENGTTRRVLRVKKMLPGTSSIPRCYGNGLIDSIISGVAAQDAAKNVTTNPSGRAMLYSGMNDGAHLKYPATYLNVLTMSDYPVKDVGWYIFDVVIPFV